MRRALALAVLLALSPPAQGQAETPDRIEIMRAAIALACHAKGRRDIETIGKRLPGIDPVAPLRKHAMLTQGIRRTFPLAIGHLTIDWLAPRALLHSIRLHLDRDDRGTPSLYALVDHHCQVQAARQIVYDDERRPERILHLGASLQPTGREEPIDPPVPAAADPGGEPVAIIDTGVNYLLPAIGKRLARDAEGQLLGYDYWDLDQRPFDANPFRSAFFPGRHGTEVASLIAAEAPVAKLLAYRFPRPDMGRFTDLVADAARKGARIVNMSLASFHRQEWTAFEAAVADHPDILFVVAAGNNSRNLDRRPVFPAALSFANMITVTAATMGGQLAKDGNWGPATVDLMAPADPIAVTSFDGTRQMVTGSSYAAARVTSLAACLLAAYPDWSTERLKARLFALAVEPSEDRLVSAGFIPEPVFGQQGACSTRRPEGAI
ncbi:MAG: S8 family serine peptidase [Alphaproteobacteria bacterium]